MQINKGNINLKEQTSRISTSVLVEGDIIVPDGCPDMSEILCADAKARVKDTEYKNGKLMVYGTVEFSALYMPDDNCAELKELSKSFDFSTAFEMNGNENTEFKANANIEHIGFTLVNSRKLSTKVMVSVKASAHQERCYEPIISMEGDDAEFTEKKYNIYIPMSETVTEIALNDLLTVPEEMADIGEILKVDAWVTSGDTRVMSGKAMVQGELHLNTIYTASDEKGSVSCVSHKVPFTEIVEAPGADEYSVVNVTFDVNGINVSVKGDLNGDTKIISMESVICARAKVSKNVSEKVIDDCYFLEGNTELKEEKMSICEYITSENTRITQRQEVAMPKNVKIEQIISCVAKPMIKNTAWESGVAKIDGALVTYLIYRDDSGKVRCAVTENEFNWEKGISEMCNIEASAGLEDVSANIQGNGCEILANIGLSMKALKPKEVSILTDCSAKESENTTTQSTMVVYFTKEGDTVWSIAKKYRTKSEKIKSANNIETEKIEPGRRLLIPMA